MKTAIKERASEQRKRGKSFVIAHFTSLIIEKSKLLRNKRAGKDDEKRERRRGKKKNEKIYRKFPPLILMKADGLIVPKDPLSGNFKEMLVI